MNRRRRIAPTAHDLARIAAAEAKRARRRERNLAIATYRAFSAPRLPRRAGNYFRTAQR